MHRFFKKLFWGGFEVLFPYLCIWWTYTGSLPRDRRGTISLSRSTFWGFALRTLWVMFASVSIADSFSLSSTLVVPGGGAIIYFQLFEIEHNVCFGWIGRLFIPFSTGS